MNCSVRLLESVLPTSVGLQAKVPEAHPSAHILGTERTGSGTLVDRRGLVLTVNYVVLGAESIEATLVDGTTAPAEIAAQDFHTGLAVVRIPGEHPHVAAGMPVSALGIGQEVFILASAGGEQRRINNGGISSLQPFDAFWEYRLDCGIITTAMNPGLGGGGLFALDGRLVGVVSLDLAEIGRFTLSIPAEYYFAHAEELLVNGRRVTRPSRAWIGFYCYSLREHLVVAGVVPGAPGDEAGLKGGDVIVSLDGAKVGDRGKLYDAIWQHKPGDTIRLRIFRNNAVHDVQVKTTDAEAFFS